MGIITGNSLPVTSLYAGILAIAFALSALAVGLTRGGKPIARCLVNAMHSVLQIILKVFTCLSML